MLRLSFCPTPGYHHSINPKPHPPYRQIAAQHPLTDPGTTASQSLSHQGWVAIVWGNLWGCGVQNRVILAWLSIAGHHLQLAGYQAWRLDMEDGLG